MGNRNVLAIDALAGGIDAMLHMAQRLPAGFPAAIVATNHLGPQLPSSLDKIIADAGPLPAKFAVDRAVRPGTISLAPPDRHLIMEDDRLWRGGGLRENNGRPTTDPMLRSIAAFCEARATGVVLTVTLDDGPSRLWSIGSDCGGGPRPDECIYRALAAAVWTLEDRSELGLEMQRKAKDRRQHRRSPGLGRQNQRVPPRTGGDRTGAAMLDEITAMRNDTVQKAAR